MELHINNLYKRHKIGKYYFQLQPHVLKSNQDHCYHTGLADGREHGISFPSKVTGASSPPPLMALEATLKNCQDNLIWLSFAS